jgi:hypothetical protein
MQLTQMSDTDAKHRHVRFRSYSADYVVSTLSLDAENAAGVDDLTASRRSRSLDDTARLAARRMSSPIILHSSNLEKNTAQQQQNHITTADNQQMQRSDEAPKRQVNDKEGIQFR